MRKSVLYLLLAVFLSAGPAVAKDEALISGSFEHQELGRVLDEIAHQMGGSVLCEPWCEGPITITLDKVPAKEAVRQALSAQGGQYDFRILQCDGPVIVVASKDKLENLCEELSAHHLVRMEFLLANSPAAKVVDTLRREYPQVAISPHPSMNGFRAKATLNELIEIKGELAKLDVIPGPPPPPLRETYPSSYGDIVNLRGFTTTPLYNVDTREYHPPADAMANESKNCGVTLISGEFDKVDLVWVLAQIAQKTGSTALCGPGVSGVVTIKLDKVAAEEALRRVLATQVGEFDCYSMRYHSPGRVLIVTKKGQWQKAAIDFFKSFPATTEVLLEHAPAARAVTLLQQKYPQVAFAAHPTKNGFYATGLKADLLQIIRETANLDRVPETPPPILRERIPVKYGSLPAIRELLAQLIPEAQITIVPYSNAFIVAGTRTVLEQVREMLGELASDPI